VITQRNIDVGSLITADATSGTSMSSLVHSNVIRVWVYVPQDDAFGVSTGVQAVIRVPTMPNLTFRGKSGPAGASPGRCHQNDRSVQRGHRARL
jgi:hypothetical protein